MKKKKTSQRKKIKDNIRERMEQRIRSLEAEKKRLQQSVKEISQAVDAILTSVTIFHGECLDDDGKVYSFSFPQPNTETPFRLTVKKAENGFYVCTAEEVAADEPQHNELNDPETVSGVKKAPEETVSEHGTNGAGEQV